MFGFLASSFFHPRFSLSGYLDATFFLKSLDFRLSFLPLWFLIPFFSISLLDAFFGRVALLQLFFFPAGRSLEGARFMD